MDFLNDNFYRAFLEESYVIEQMSNQNKILSYATECVYLESGDIQSIMALNESVMDTVKNVIGKFIEFIKNAFNKFRGRVSELFTTDKAFIDKYKEVITKNDFKPHKLVDMWEYNPDALTNIKVPTYDFNKLRTNLGIKSSADVKDKKFDEELFINTEMGDLHGKFPKITDVKDLVSAAIKGEDTRDEVYMNTLDKNKILTFCTGFDKYSASLEQDKKALEENGTKIQAELKKYEDEASKTVNANESTVWSNVYETYIIREFEEDKKNNPAMSNNSSSSSTSTPKATVQTANIQTQSDQMKAAGYNSSNANEDTVKDIQFMATASENYYKYCVSISSTKLTETIAMYKDYMKILRIHVRDYIGGEKSADQGNNATQVTGEEKTITFNDPETKEQITFGLNGAISDTDIEDLEARGYNSKKSKKNPAPDGKYKPLLDTAEQQYGEKKSFIIKSNIASFLHKVDGTWQVLTTK